VVHARSAGTLAAVTGRSADEALARLSPADRRWTEAFRDEVRGRFGPRLRDLRLFGSKTRGDDHDESDIDVLVLIDGATDTDFRIVHEIAAGINPSLMPVVADFERYHSPRSRASGFYEELRLESVRL
jgi:predicted nucleotidyltransferase